MRWLLFLILLVSNFSITAQPANFEMAMTDASSYFNNISKDNQYESSYKQFVQLSNAYPKEWLPKYYAALVQIKIALLSKDDMDQQADIAIDWVNQCKQIQINDEILCAESLAYTTKMQVNPPWRWLKYKDIIKSSLQKAKKLNPNNPRIYVLEANLEFHLPKVFGGGCPNALPIAQRADKLLKMELGKRKYLPSWGYTSIKEILLTCKN